MSESKLRELSMEFSVDIIELVKYLKSIKESIISNQIGRSGTSIGANIHEAQYAQGKKDFISKLEIALKEASETGYWLELLYRTRYIDEQTFKMLSSKCTSLRAMLIASCRTAKARKSFFSRGATTRRISFTAPFAKLRPKTARQAGSRTTRTACSFSTKPPPQSSKTRQK